MNSVLKIFCLSAGLLSQMQPLCCAVREHGDGTSSSSSTPLNCSSTTSSSTSSETTRTREESRERLRNQGFNLVEGEKLKRRLEQERRARSLSRLTGGQKGVRARAGNRRTQSNSPGGLRSSASGFVDPQGNFESKRDHFRRLAARRGGRLQPISRSALSTTAAVYDQPHAGQTFPHPQQRRARGRGEGRSFHGVRLAPIRGGELERGRRSRRHESVSNSSSSSSFNDVAVEPEMRLAALHQAILQGRIFDFVKLIESEDLDFFAEHEGMNAVELSLQKGYCIILDTLLKHPKVKSILRKEAVEGHRFIPEERINTPFAVHGGSTTYLHTAVGLCQPNLVARLIIEGAEVNMDNSLDQSPLDVAYVGHVHAQNHKIKLKCARIIAALIKAGGVSTNLDFSHDENKKQGYANLLCNIVRIADPEAVELMLSEVDVNATEDNLTCGTALCVAVNRYVTLQNNVEKHDQLERLVEIIDNLISHGASLNAYFFPTAQANEDVSLLDYINENSETLVRFIRVLGEEQRVTLQE